MRRQAFFSGILIGLGAAGFLALGGIAGAVIFAFGLIGVVLTGVPLYTGKAGVITNIWKLLEIWFWNVLGCVAVGLLLKYAEGVYTVRAAEVVTGRYQLDILPTFLRAVGCGLIIDIAVWMRKRYDSMLPVLFGVPLFILCGFYHSIADVVYITAAGDYDLLNLCWYYPSIFLGNYVGCNLRRLVLWKSNKEDLKPEI